MARHRRPVSVRDDGLEAVIDPLVTACGIDMAVLVDVDSGMLLDAWMRGGLGDAEALGAGHADVVRALLTVAGSPAAELELSEDGYRHHLVRCVADPSGGRLALAVVVAGPPRVVRRTRRHLRELPDACLTAGPWMFALDHEGVPAARVPPPQEAAPPVPAGMLRASVPAPRCGPAPPSALPPARRVADR